MPFTYKSAFLHTYFFMSYYSNLKRSQDKSRNNKKDSLGINYDRTLVSEFEMLAQTWLKIATLIKVDLWVFATHCSWFQVKISSSIRLCILGELAEGGSMAVALGVSDMQQVTRNMYNLIFLVCIFLYLRYYPHTLRDSVSPVCGMIANRNGVSNICLELIVCWIKG